MGERDRVQDVAAAPLAQDNTETVFRHLVQQHQQRLYRFVLKNIGNPSDAEEIAQQAFVEAATSFERFRGASELSTWLYGIAMNLVRNHLSRAPHRRYQFEDEEALADVEGHTPEPAVQLEHSQTNRALLAELQALPNDMREVLLMVALDEVSYEEAAVMLSIPIGTVRSRVSRARASLRRKLEAKGIELPF